MVAGRSREDPPLIWLLRFKFEFECVTSCVGIELFYEVLLGVYSMASAEPNSSCTRLPLCSNGFDELRECCPPPNPPATF